MGQRGPIRLHFVRDEIVAPRSCLGTSTHPSRHASDAACRPHLTESPQAKQRPPQGSTPTTHFGGRMPSTARATTPIPIVFYLQAPCQYSKDTCTMPTPDARRAAIRRREWAHLPLCVQSSDPATNPSHARKATTNRCARVGCPLRIASVACLTSWGAGTDESQTPFPGRHAMSWPFPDVRLSRAHPRSSGRDPAPQCGTPRTAETARGRVRGFLPVAAP